MDDDDEDGGDDDEVNNGRAFSLGIKVGARDNQEAGVVECG